MALFWIGDAAFILIAVPVLLYLLQNVINPADEIQKTAVTIAGAASVVVEHLEPVSQLATTQSLVHQTTAGLARYGAALDRIL